VWEREGEKKGHDTCEEGRMKPNGGEIRINNIKIYNKIRNYDRYAHTK